MLHFAGRNIDEMKKVFAETIADYRDWCDEGKKGDANQATTHAEAAMNHLQQVN
jgi:hypothetical protein